jgi:23S rRNA (uridine2552-2'-O)-methyltransferase
LTDESRSLSLAKRAAEIALMLLKQNGRFVCKVFEGESLNPFKTEISPHFRQVRVFRPKAVRKGSREVYLVGLGLVK